MKIIDGKAISDIIKQEIAEETKELIDRSGVTPGLAVIIVGEDPASKIYVRNKRLACERVGFYSEAYELPATTSEEELISLIKKLNDSENIHGILVQLPVPKHIDSEKILRTIDPSKDVDAFHPYNVGLIMTGDYDFLPCTPAGIMELLKRSGVSVEGKECVVVGRSNIVGKPMAMLLLHDNGTVTIAHSRTVGLDEVCRRADILVSAVGKPFFIKADMVKEGAVVIDVGMNRLPDGKLVGDVCYDEVSEKASLITPVPGGVGPMTIAMLMRNTLTSAKRKADK